jgi:hypothetical protein
MLLMLLQLDSANQQLHLSELRRIIQFSRLLNLKLEKISFIKKAVHSGFNWLIWLLAVY